jgi:O-antigen ligase
MHPYVESAQEAESPARLLYMDKLWIGIALTMILIDEWALTGSYIRSPMFEPIKVLGMNVAPIEALIVIAVLPLLKRICNSVLNYGVVGHPLIAALVIVSYSVGVTRGYARLGTIVGLAEIKCLFMLIIFIYLSRKALARGTFHRVVPLLSWACILHSVFDLVRYFVHPIVDATLGARTEVNIIPCLLLPVFVARMIDLKEQLRLTYPLCATVVLIDLYLSQSRAALVEALSGVFLTTAFCIFRRTRPKMRIATLFPAAGLIVLVLLLATGVTFSNSEFVRSFAFWQDQSDQGHNASNLGHYYDVLRGIQMIIASPITGMGFGGKLPGLETATFEIIHNEFLHFWVLFGIGGAALWMYMFVFLPIRFIRKLDRARMKGYEIRDEHYLIFSMVGCTVAHFIAVPSFHLFLPQVWFTGLYLATLTSIPSVRKVVIAKLNSMQQLMPTFGSGA